MRCEEMGIGMMRRGFAPKSWYYALRVLSKGHAPRGHKLIAHREGAAATVGTDDSTINPSGVKPGA